MAKMADAGKTDAIVRERALSIASGARERDYDGEIRALFSFVRDNVRYIRDIRGVETVQTPRKTLEYMQGDCDDQSVLLASLIESIGGQAQFVAVGSMPGIYSHVYVEARTAKGQWVALDPIVRVPVGWSAPGMRSRMVEGI